LALTVTHPEEQQTQVSEANWNCRSDLESGLLLCGVVVALLPQQAHHVHFALQKHGSTEQQFG
jgi:hypothetical protein